MTYTELYNICHDEAVAYANSEQWSKRTGKEKSFLIQGYLDAMMEKRKSEITEKKKEYPKTYAECCAALGIPIHGGIALVGNWCMEDGYIAQHLETLRALSKLLIYRDAYWKVAGEEMELGKPWTPQDANTFSIFYDRLTCEIEKQDGYCGANSTLEFSTAEMRDAFYENFKELINECKELL